MKKVNKKLKIWEKKEASEVFHSIKFRIVLTSSRLSVALEITRKKCAYIKKSGGNWRCRPQICPKLFRIFFSSFLLGNKKKRPKELFHASTDFQFPKQIFPHLVYLSAPICVYFSFSYHPHIKFRCLLLKAIHLLSKSTNKREKLITDNETWNMMTNSRESSESFVVKSAWKDVKGR